VFSTLVQILVPEFGCATPPFCPAAVFLSGAVNIVRDRAPNRLRDISEWPSF
jgi:hypothetical protein